MSPPFPLEATSALKRIAEALERLRPPPPPAPDFSVGAVFHYDAAPGEFQAASSLEPPLDLLLGIDGQKARLVRDLRRLAAGRSFNHALLWGARGAGKSSLVKAAVIAVAAEAPALKLVEVDRDAIDALPLLFTILRSYSQLAFVVLCDDLSFEAGAGAAKSLKSALEGGVRGPPSNVMFVATSNRRHLAPRSHQDGDRMSEAEDAEETVSVSDRFGLWLGFPPMDQPTYLAVVAAYAARLGLAEERGGDEALDRRALQWAQSRGGRSGRVAFQFIRDLAAERDRPLRF